MDILNNKNNIMKINQADNLKILIATKSSNSPEQCLLTQKIRIVIARLSSELEIDLEIDQENTSDKIALFLKKNKHVVIFADSTTILPKNNKHLVIQVENEFYSTPEYQDISSWKYWISPDYNTLHIRKKNSLNPNFIYSILESYITPPIFVVDNFSQDIEKYRLIRKSVSDFFPFTTFASSSDEALKYLNKNLSFQYFYINILTNSLFGQTQKERNLDIFISISEVDKDGITHNDPLSVTLRYDYIGKIYEGNDIIKLLWILSGIIKNSGYFTYYSNKSALEMAYKGEYYYPDNKYINHN